MVSSVQEFFNYIGQSVLLLELSWIHILERHPEIRIEDIKNTLLDPDVVLMSEINPESELYFMKKNAGKKRRFVLVVVKHKNDGTWISTAMTKSKISNGVVIFRK